MSPWWTMLSSGDIVVGSQNADELEPILGGPRLRLQSPPTRLFPLYSTLNKHRWASQQKHARQQVTREAAVAVVEAVGAEEGEVGQEGSGTSS